MSDTKTEHTIVGDRGQDLVTNRSGNLYEGDVCRMGLEDDKNALWVFSHLENKVAHFTSIGTYPRHTEINCHQAVYPVKLNIEWSYERKSD